MSNRRTFKMTIWELEDGNKKDREIIDEEADELEDLGQALLDKVGL